MSVQAGLLDLPDPVPPIRSARGRARETFARTVVADVSVHDSGALRAEASSALDHSVVIGEGADAEDDDLPDLLEEISTSAAAAVQWCVEPTMGMGPLLESGAIRIDMIGLSAEEKSAGLVRVAWTVTVKILIVSRDRAGSHCHRPVSMIMAGRWASVGSASGPHPNTRSTTESHGGPDADQATATSVGYTDQARHASTT